MWRIILPPVLWMSLEALRKASRKMTGAEHQTTE